MAEDPDGYGEKAYWDSRYTENAKGPTFEWYLGWAGLKDDIIGALSKAGAPVDPTSSVLMVGCGNSPMSNDMFRDGWTAVTSVDYSDVCIAQMTARFPDTVYLQADVRDMKQQFASESFDFAIDKGTLDAIACGIDATRNAVAMLTEVDRVLKPEGVFLMITYGSPDGRMPYLNEMLNWDVTHQFVGETRYMYKCVKKPTELLA